MKIRGTDFVMFQISDMPAAVKFYGDTLGLVQEVESDDFAEFNCGNVTLSLIRYVEQADKPDDKQVVGHIGLAVDDVQTAVDELKAKNIPIETEPTDYGCCQGATVQDPDGNVVILHHRADGTVGQEEA